MRIYIMTDLEGVCGVRNFEDWCGQGGRYYERARELLTAEINAAIEGFIEGGADEFVVSDGHGPGAVNGVLLHPRASFIRGWPTKWPFLLDEQKYDAVAWVGQHAKAGSTLAHLCHTQSCGYRDESVNGVSIGEFGQFAHCASELGVRAIFGSGDEAFAKEAQALVPGIEAVAVKRGTQPDPGHNLPTEAYCKHNSAAIHRPIEEARSRIRAGAKRAVERARTEDFGQIDLKPPYERVTVLRGEATRPPRVSRNTHPSSIIELFNAPFDFKPIEGADPMRCL